MRDDLGDRSALQCAMRQILPNLSSLYHEAPSRWRAELAAGLTTAALLIPQSMAYAMLAGLPPEIGLYAATLPILAYAIFGTCKSLSVGPVAMDSMITLSTLGGIAMIQTPRYAELAMLLALSVGVSLIFMSLLQVGRLIRFLSPAMMAGFTSAAAMIIGLSQLRHLIGVDLERSSTLQDALVDTYINFDQVSPTALLIGLSSLLIFKGLPKISQSMPAGLIGVVMMTALGALFSFEELGVEVVGSIPRGLPQWRVPRLETLTDLLHGPHAETFVGGVLSIALLAFMEAIAVGDAVSRPQGYRVRPGQELFALGTSNIGSALLGGYPVAGGFSRTAVNDRAGARTPLASITTFAAVMLVIWQLTPLLYTLPKATLAAMIIGAVSRLIDLKAPLRLFRNDPVQAWVWVSSFIATLTLGLQLGILIGAAASLTTHFRAQSRAYQHASSNVDSSSTER